MVVGVYSGCGDIKWLWGYAVVVGVYSGWDSFLLKCSCEVFLDEVSSA